MRRRLHDAIAQRRALRQSQIAEAHRRLQATPVGSASVTLMHGKSATERSTQSNSSVVE